MKRKYKRKKSNRRKYAKRRNPRSSTPSVKFRDLKIGQWFDFIGPDLMMNSFYKRVKKISSRGYVDEDGGRYTVGSINAKVYHVSSSNPRRAKRSIRKPVKTYYVIRDREGAWLIDYKPSAKANVMFGPTTNLFDAERALQREVSMDD